MQRILKSSTHAAVAVSIFCLLASGLYAGEIRGTASVPGSSSAKNVAVWVGAIAGKTFAAPAKHAVVDQHHMKFVPHVLVIMKGTTVDFLNSDQTLHNVYWPWIGTNKHLARNLGTRPRGQKLSFKFDNPGVAPLLCNVHTEMYGYIVIVSTPYFAVSNADGEFDIKGVPPGHYTLKFWSERGRKTDSQPITVAATGVTTVHVTYRK